MKHSTKILFVMAAIGLSLSFFAGCGGMTGNQGEAVDNTKTQLYVYSYNGGYGNDWLLEVKERFEEEYKDYVSSDGKVGVQIMPSIVDKVIGSNMIDTFSTNSNEIFFTESVFYYDWVRDGGDNSLMLDITDAVTAPLDDLGESRSIYDKMTPELQEFLNAGTDTEKKLYAVPYRTDIEGIIYDMDLFNDSSLYYAKGGCPSEFSEFTQENNENAATGTFSDYMYTDFAGERSAGPDGKYGTDDDGLPATYEEFFNLCDYMAYELSITPFTWGGKASIRSTYLGWLYQQLLADYEGLDGYTSYFTYEGTSDHLVDTISDDGTMTFLPETDISKDGSVISRSAGRYYATKFFETLIKNSDYYDGKCFNGTQTHMLAQMDYLESKYEREQIAFLVDGIWWENEANQTFEEMAQTEESDSRLNRSFGLLPMPKATMDQIGEPTTWVDNLASLCFVRSNISEEKIDLAKKFIRFCFTDESNKNFNLLTGCARAMGGYTLSDEELGQLSSFGQSVYRMISSAPIVAPYGKNDVYKLNVANRTIQFGGDLVCSESSIYDEFKYGTQTAETIFRNSMDGLKDYFN